MRVLRVNDARLSGAFLVLIQACATPQELEEGTARLRGSTGGTRDASPPGDGGSVAAGGGGAGGTAGNVSVSGGAGSVAVPSGGAGASAGSSGASSDAGGDSRDGGPVDASISCAASEKLCNGACTAPSPAVGCAMTGCSPCAAAPDNGRLVCSNGQCSFECNSGYVRASDHCAPAPATGGAGGGGGAASGGAGSGGAGGSAPACDPAKCTCAPYRGTPCCTLAGACSCSTVPGLCF